MFGLPKRSLLQNGLVRPIRRPLQATLHLRIAGPQTGDCLPFFPHVWLHTQIQYTRHLQLVLCL